MGGVEEEGGPTTRTKTIVRVSLIPFTQWWAPSHFLFTWASGWADEGFSVGSPHLSHQSKSSSVTLLWLDSSAIERVSQAAKSGGLRRHRTPAGPLHRHHHRLAVVREGGTQQVPIR